jgi:hypothetical protein
MGALQELPPKVSPCKLRHPFKRRNNTYVHLPEVQLAGKLTTGGLRTSGGFTRCSHTLA